MLRTSLRAKLRPIAREESTLVEQERDVVHRKGVDIVRMQQIMGAVREVFGGGDSCASGLL